MHARTPACMMMIMMMMLLMMNIINMARGWGLHTPDFERAESLRRDLWLDSASENLAHLAEKKREAW